MFFLKQTKQKQQEYINYLKVIGSLSNLFSESKTPYLYYRIAEKVFCRSFCANDLSRSDVAVDANIGRLGIGLKTFLIKNNKSLEKIAEFNRDRDIYKNLKPKELACAISELRNKRIDIAKRLHALESLIYHCVLRNSAEFIIYEEEMNQIDISEIRNVEKKNNSIHFDDKKNEYSFLLSKSTLTKRFATKSYQCKFYVEILDDPLTELKKIINLKNLPLYNAGLVFETIYLPLYSKKFIVHEKSGLNQWNAGGRKRDANEVYIPIRAIIHKHYPNFFPSRDKPFNLKLPNGKVMQAKICQDGGKALMSCSNKELGQWILRDVLNLKEGELLTYKKLKGIDIDSVRIDKIDNQHYEINFAQIGSYESFEDSLMVI